jgi:hypothetical protein
MEPNMQEMRPKMKTWKKVALALGGGAIILFGGCSVLTLGYVAGTTASKASGQHAPARPGPDKAQGEAKEKTIEQKKASEATREEKGVAREGESPKPKPKPVQKKPAPKPVQKKPAPQPQYASVGQKVTVDDEAYRVDAASKQNGIHSALENLEGTFVAVNFTFFNMGSETRTLDESALKLKDAQGRSYEVIQDNMMVVPTSKDIFLEDVSPGVPKQGRVYFQVPPTANGFVLESSHTNWFSSAKPAKIKLGF